MRHQDLADRTGKVHLHQYMGVWCYTAPTDLLEARDGMPYLLATLPAYQWCEDRHKRLYRRTKR